MRTEDIFDSLSKFLTDRDPRLFPFVSQLLEYRATIIDNEINNRLLQELVFKYAEAEKRLKHVNQELIAKQNRIEQDLQSAAEIQRSLLPTNLNCSDILDVAWRFQPCEKIGGDIFNLIQLDDKHWAIYIIDVAGHGVPAAMIAVTVFQYLQHQSGIFMLSSGNSSKNREIRQPAQMLEFLDQEYTFDRFDNFFTMNYVILNIQTGALTSSSAGHPPPIILRKDGTLVSLKKGGRPIGTIDLRISGDKPIVYEEEHELIGTGDKLLFYTDGVNEYQNEQGQFYGMERFYKKLKELKDRKVTDLIDTMFESLMEFGNNTEPKDDISLLGLELK